MLELQTKELLPTRQRQALPKAQKSKPLLPDTSLHPATFAIPLASTVVFLAACWVAFGADPYMELAMVTLILVMFLGLLAGGALMGRDMTPERRHDRSFRAFLRGNVDTYTGLIAGREALLQIAAMPLALAIGGVLIVAIAVTH